MAACRSESANLRRAISRRCGGSIRLASIHNWRTRSRNWRFTCVGQRRSRWWLKARGNGGPGDGGKGRDALPGSGILGFIVAERRRQVGHIITIDVIEQARRLGVGSALLTAAEDRLRENGAIAVELETPVNNDAAIRFYKRKGYFVEKTVHGYYSNQLDALVMGKALAEDK